MPSPSYTYTLTNGTTADASKVSQNFTDILNGVTDGTKDLSINAITCAGNLTVNGNTTLGNASSDTVTITASLASDIVPSSDGTRSLGSATYGFAGLFLGDTAGETVKIAPGNNTADWTMTLPTSGGTNAWVPETNGSGTLAWIPRSGRAYAASGDYTVTDTDGYSVILMTTGATDRTVTLPTAADNNHRRILIKKVDSGTGVVIIDGEGAETIDGYATTYLTAQYSYIEVVCDGSGWYVARVRDYVTGTALTTTSLTTNMASASTMTVAPGTWAINYCIGYTVQNGATNGNNSYIIARVANTSSSTVGGTTTYAQGGPTYSSTANYCGSMLNCYAAISTAATATYWLQAKRNDNAGTGSGSWIQSTSYSESYFRAYRII